MWILLLFLIGCRPPEATPTETPTPPDERPVNPDVGGRGGVLAPGEGIPVVMVTRGAIYYAARPDGMIEWSYLPTGERPCHAIMGLKPSARGGELLHFEMQPRGVLAVLPSRDHRNVRD